MLNRLILAVKAAGLNHKQIKSVLIADEPEQARQQYPLLRIWPGQHPLNTETGGQNHYQIGITITDRHEDNAISQLEAISDCDQIVVDIIASLQYMYKSSGIRWSINDTIEHIYDDTPDKIGGAAVLLEARVSYSGDFCQVPSNDFAFPDMNLSILTILDGGDAEFDLELEVADGGTA